MEASTLSPAIEGATDTQEQGVGADQTASMQCGHYSPPRREKLHTQALVRDQRIILAEHRRLYGLCTELRALVCELLGEFPPGYQQYLLGNYRHCVSAACYQEVVSFMPDSSVLEASR